MITQPPTCTEKGEQAYTCTVCGASITEEVEALGHSFVPSGIYVWSADYLSCSVSGVCMRNGCSETIIIHAQVSSRVTSAATCIEMGVTTYTATFAVDWAETQTKPAPI